MRRMGEYFTLLIYQESGFDGDPSAAPGTKNTDQDIYAATFRTSDGTQLGSSTEIDEFTTQSSSPRRHQRTL